MFFFRYYGYLFVYNDYIRVRGVREERKEEGFLDKRDVVCNGDFRLI